MDETEISTDERYSIVTGGQYSPFKLFLMTQLWRAGVASDAFWKNVRLGPHEERLREMLLRAYPGQTYEYACVISGSEIPAIWPHAPWGSPLRKDWRTYLVRLHRLRLLLALYSFEPLKGSLRSPFHPPLERRATNNLRCRWLHRVEVRHDKPLGEGASSVSEKASSRQLPSAQTLLEYHTV
jgi:hypothetical protein